MKLYLGGLAVVVAVVTVAALGAVAVAQQVGPWATVTFADGSTARGPSPVTIEYDTTTTPPPPPQAGTVGFLGCSMTKGAVEGYPGDHMWDPFRAAYGGGTVKRWADVDGIGARQWESFDWKQANDPAAVFWLGLCTDKTPGNDLPAAVIVITELLSRVPDATIYVSPQPGYTDGHVCPIAGPDGPDRMAQLAADVVAAGLALEGPAQGPLAAWQTSDGCHGNDTGKALLGQQLFDFFG